MKNIHHVKDPLIPGIIGSDILDALGCFAVA
jgi:hypothetical protein